MLAADWSSPSSSAARRRLRIAVVFVVALPLISVVCYALAGVVALGGFLLLGKLGGWVVWSLALVLLSVLAWRERYESGR